MKEFRLGYFTSNKEWVVIYSTESYERLNKISTFVAEELDKGNIKPLKMMCKLHGYKLIHITLAARNTFTTIRENRREDNE